MRIVYLLLILSCMMTERLYAQITCIGDEDLVSKVQNSDKRYKFIYVFCNYCQASQVRYPEVVKLIHDNKTWTASLSVRRIVLKLRNMWILVRSLLLCT